MKVFTDLEGNDYRGGEEAPRRGLRADVHAATAPDGQAVAIKVYREQFPLAAIERAMLQDIRAVDPRCDEWLVALVGHGSWEGRPFLALPWMAESLVEWLPTHGLRERLVVLELAAAAVVRLHGCRTETGDYRVHRDLKPENLRVAQQGGVWVVRLADLGLTRRGDMADSDVSTARTSRYFTPPEQTLPLGGPPSSSWDVYALAVTVFFGITNRLPRPSMEAGNQLNDLALTLLDLSAQAERGFPLSSRDQARLDELCQRPPDAFLDLRRRSGWRTEDTEQLAAAMAEGAEGAKRDAVWEAAARLGAALASALETDPRKRESSARPLVAALREARAAIFSKGEIVLASAEPVREGAEPTRSDAPDRPWKIALFVLWLMWVLALGGVIMWLLWP